MRGGGTGLWRAVMRGALMRSAMLAPDGGGLGVGEHSLHRWYLWLRGRVSGDATVRRSDRARVFGKSQGCGAGARGQGSAVMHVA